MVSAGSDGTFRERDTAESSFLLRLREGGRGESLDIDCMGTYDTALRGSAEGGRKGERSQRRRSCDG